MHVQVLRQVYVEHQNVDEDLVQSIVIPAGDPNAAAVFYQVISGWGQPVPDLLSRLKVCPFALLTERGVCQCMPQAQHKLR